MSKTKSKIEVHPPVDPLTGDPIVKKEQFAKVYRNQLQTDRIEVRSEWHRVEFREFVNQAFQLFQMWIYIY